MGNEYKEECIDERPDPTRPDPTRPDPSLFRPSADGENLMMHAI